MTTTTTYKTITLGSNTASIRAGSLPLAGGCTPDREGTSLKFEYPGPGLKDWEKRCPGWLYRWDPFTVFC